MAAATHFAQQRPSGSAGARETYLGVLRAGGSRHPVPRLRDAGLDMDSPAG